MEKVPAPWLEGQIQMLLSATTKDELYDGLAKASKLLGFDYFAYGIRIPVSISTPKIELLNNYPEAWQALYDSNEYLHIDPTVHHGLRTIEPVIWEEKLFSNARSLWEDAKSFGLSHGWAQSSFSSSGVSGMLTLARSSDAISENELLYRTPHLVWFNQLAQIGLQKFLLPEILEPSRIRLTARESEILSWTADGKTAYEISVILDIKERTVHFHLTNVLKKFGVTNKIAATVRAVLLGLI